MLNNSKALSVDNLGLSMLNLARASRDSGLKPYANFYAKLLLKSPYTSIGYLLRDLPERDFNELHKDCMELNAGNAQGIDQRTAMSIVLMVRLGLYAEGELPSELPELNALSLRLIYLVQMEYSFRYKNQHIKHSRIGMLDKYEIE